MKTEFQRRKRRSNKPHWTLIFRQQGRMTMKPMKFLLLAAFVLISPTISHAQVAGSTPLGVTVTELQAVVKGWSVKRTVLGQAVYNDKDEKVGSVDDIIITPDKAVSYAIVGTGGFL